MVELIRNDYSVVLTHENGPQVGAHLPAKFDPMKPYFVSPAELQIRPDILEYLDRLNVPYEIVEDAESVLGKAVDIYQTRIQPERMRKSAGLGRYTMDSSVLPRMRPDAVILHPARYGNGCRIGWKVTKDHVFRQGTASALTSMSQE